jgi:hypothetical protein
LKYKFAIVIHRPAIVWKRGPFPASEHDTLLFSDKGEMRFLQKIKFLPNLILMLGTFLFALSHVKYQISSKNSTGKIIVFETP